MRAASPCGRGPLLVAQAASITKAGDSVATATRPRDLRRTFRVPSASRGAPRREPRCKALIAPSSLIDPVINQATSQPETSDRITRTDTTRTKRDISVRTAKRQSHKHGILRTSVCGRTKQSLARCHVRGTFLSQTWLAYSRCCISKGERR